MSDQQANHIDNLDLLIVEDDLALASYLSAALVDHGYRLATAFDRQSALGHFQPVGAPPLVLLDLGLPPLPSTAAEGLALLDEILKRAPLTKIMVLTGQDEEAAAREAILRGAFDFLVKPATLSAILQSLSRARLFATEEQRLAECGETMLRVHTRISEGPKMAAAAAEEQLLRRTLSQTHYNVAETARRLGLAREHVYYYLNKYGIQRPE